VEPYVVAIEDKLWNELVEVSQVERPTQIKGYYDDIVKKEDPDNIRFLLTFRNHRGGKLVTGFRLKIFGGNAFG